MIDIPPPTSLSVGSAQPKPSNPPEPDQEGAVSESSSGPTQVAPIDPVGSPPGAAVASAAQSTGIGSDTTPNAADAVLADVEEQLAAADTSPADSASGQVPVSEASTDHSQLPTTDAGQPAPDITQLSSNAEPVAEASSKADDTDPVPSTPTTVAQEREATAGPVTEGEGTQRVSSAPDVAVDTASDPDRSSTQSTPTQTQEPQVKPPIDPTATANGKNGLSGVIGLLVEKELLSKDQGNQIQYEAINSGKSPEQLLKEKKIVAEVPLTETFAEFYNIPFISIDSTGVSPEAITMLPEGVARRYQMLPFTINKKDNTLSVAMGDPLDLSAIDFASQKTGMRILPHFATQSELERKIAERYAQNLSSEVSAALEDTSIAPQKKAELADLSALSKEVIRQAPITKIVETVLSFAIKSRASDVHIEPQETRTRVRYRIDGILAEKLILPKSVHEAVVSRIKIMSNLKIDEKRVPQDGRFSFQSSGEEVDLRVSTLPTIHGEKIVMRLLKKNITVPTLSELGLRGYALKHVQDAIRVPHGIVLVTGPTGSGKTTTLYSVLHQINKPGVNIMTLEDPVEYEIQGVNQVQINPQAGLSFASGLRSFLRQDPNIIMVGEIRDTETAELAVQASLTGHLVFSTLHTSSAAGAIPRLLDMGAEPFLVSSSMTLTMGQRIVRKINPEFKEEYKPDQAVVDDIKEVLGPLFEAWCKQHNKDPNNITLFKTSADRPQTEPEYKGRIGIFEVMTMTEELGRMILEHKSAADMEKVAIKDGMLLMKQDGYMKALEGITTIEEVLRVAEV